MIIKEIAKITFPFKNAKKMMIDSLSKTKCEFEAIDISRRIWRQFDDPKQYKELIDIYWKWHLKNVVNQQK